MSVPALCALTGRFTTVSPSPIVLMALASIMSLQIRSSAPLLLALRTSAACASTVKSLEGQSTPPASGSAARVVGSLTVSPDRTSSGPLGVLIVVSFRRIAVMRRG